MNKTKRQRNQTQPQTYYDQAAEKNPKPKAPRKGPLMPRTETQADLVTSVDHSKITLVMGPPGVGKTYVIARMAAAALKAGEIEEIILTRPAVEAGEKLGYLPGDEKEKMSPYLQPYLRGLNDELGGGHVEYLLRHEMIRMVPLAFMQGLSWDAPSMVLFDEAQNSTPAQMKMFLTRIGVGARVVIDGDPGQKMISGSCGLLDAVEILKDVVGVDVVRFGVEDIVRSDIVRDIIVKYRDREDRNLELVAA